MTTSRTFSGPSQPVERFIRDIAEGVINYGVVSERHLPIEDPLLDVVGRGEDGRSEVYQHILRDFADFGESTRRFGRGYFYGLDLRSRLTFVDGEGLMRLPRYRSQPTETATPETGRNEEGSIFVARSTSTMTVVLDDKVPTPRPVPSPTGPPTTRDREVGVGVANQGQDWWRKWINDAYIGNRLTLQGGEIVGRTNEQSGLPGGMTSPDQREGVGLLGDGLLGNPLADGLLGSQKPYVRTSDTTYPAGEITYSITPEDGKFRFGTIDCQGEGEPGGWFRAAKVVIKHYDGTPGGVDWSTLLAMGEPGVDTSSGTPELKIRTPDGVATFTGTI